MYWEFFGFNEPPFALTPNPAFLFLSSAHQEAFAHLLFAIENRAGFIELSGEVGTGKTTIIRTLLNQLDPDIYRTALIFNPTLSPLGLFREINAEYGISCTGSDLQELHQALNAYLLEENRADRTVVLVIDEAQNLSTEVLEQIRLISNLETERSKLIQIVLVGQPELRTLLAREELRQLAQRITVRYHLKPMHYADSCEYIRHRIRFAAGGSEPLVFSPGAAKRIFRFSGGLPRLINSACDRALLLAYTREAREVTPAMAATCTAELRKDLPRSAARWPKALAALCALALACAAGVWMASGRGPAQAAKGAAALTPGTPPAPATKAAVPAPAATAADTAPTPSTASTSSTSSKVTAARPLPRQLALNELAGAKPEDNLRAALNAVLAAWRTPQLAAAPLQTLDLQALARLRGLTATRVTGDLAALARLDTPALLQVAVPGGSRYLALVGLDKDRVRVEPALAGRSTLTRAELDEIWSGAAMVLWKDFHGVAARGKGGSKALLALLKGAGCVPPPAGGTGSKMVQSISEFQRREGLPVDGKARGVTLMLLYRRAGGFFPPALSREPSGATGAAGPGTSRVRAGWPA